jgi:hypothetical protein
MKYERRLQTAIKKYVMICATNLLLHTEEGSKLVIGKRHQASFVCFLGKEKNGWKGRCFGVHNLAAGQLKGQAPTAKGEGSQLPAAYIVPTLTARKQPPDVSRPLSGMFPLVSRLPNDLHGWIPWRELVSQRLSQREA